MPAVVERKYGKGKVVWSAAFLENDARKNFKDIFANIVKKNVVPLFTVEASKYVEIVIFKDGENEYYISLVDICDEPTQRKATIALRSGGNFEITALPSEKVIYDGNAYTCSFE